MALKWMLCFEEPETRTLWLAKATPREWLKAGETPIAATNLTTRYGRVSFTLSAPASASGGYSVHASLWLPASFGESPPEGGIRLRLRAPLGTAGKLSNVTVGGKPWTAFSASKETIDFAASEITPGLIEQARSIRAYFLGKNRPLRPASSDSSRRVVHTTRARPDVEDAPLSADTATATAPPTPSLATGTPHCPGTTTLLDAFELNGSAWAACEDLQRPDGALVLISSAGDAEWFDKSYEPYGTNASDHEYYLGFGRQTVANATTDILGAKLLEATEITWAAVERAVPPIRASGRGGEWGTNCKGVRTFVGSRDAAYDATIDDLGHVIPGHDWDGCSSVRQIDTIAIQAYNDAVHQPKQTYDAGGAADGIVGGAIPTAIFYLPMRVNNTPTYRYWTTFVAAVPDMAGNREQDFWYRYQQIECSGQQMKPPCKLHTHPEYWDTYWFARFPGANASDTLKETLRTGPVRPSSARGFYQTLLSNRRWWAAELRTEGTHELKLPSPASTNGTWLYLQATHAMIKSMISRESTWHPRYGVSPGYGSVVYNGVPDLFIATATAALEWGAMLFARGVISNHFTYYVRDDGMVWHRTEALPASARMLTVLALHHHYAADDGTFALQLFPRARALAELLIARRNASLLHDPNDPRHGIPMGADDAIHPEVPLGALMLDEAVPQHWYATAAEMCRAFDEIGRVWTAVGGRTKRDDVSAHGLELLRLAPILRQQLHASLNRTVHGIQPRCWALTAERAVMTRPSFRGYSEMLYSGVLTTRQVDDIYLAASGAACGPRTLTLGSPAIGNGAVLSTPSSFGLAYGLLQHDMPERFLLHYFATSAHGYTRGTATTPESSDVTNRDVPTVAYSAASEVLAPTYLKWMLCFEEPETRTLWLAKATPREWLKAGETPIAATNLTTRYGRVSFTLSAPASASGGYSVHASLWLPASFGESPPEGGIRLRLRAPLGTAGKLSNVTVGGKPWTAFSASKETIDFAASEITPGLISAGLPSIIATFAL